jgi:hypothetical protein
VEAVLTIDEVAVILRTDSGRRSVLREQSDGRVLEPRAAERHVLERLLEVREAEARLELERQQLEAQLKLAIGKAAGLHGARELEDPDRDGVR